MDEHWLKLLEPGHKKLLNDLLLQAYNSSAEVYPPKEKVFSAFKFFKPEDCKVVILGQDPYHGPNQANGLAFSVGKNEKIPPSLRNMFKELLQDLEIKSPSNGDLSPWAEQGVLLINAVFTVEAAKAGSHGQLGWQSISKQIIKELANNGCKVFILLGAWAQAFADDLNIENNIILKTSHPSPLSAHRGFLGSNIFSKCNEALRKIGQKPINWQLNNKLQYDLFK